MTQLILLGQTTAADIVTTTSAPATTAAPATSTAPASAPMFQSRINDAVSTAPSTQISGTAPPWWDVSTWDGTMWVTVSLATIVTLMIVAWGALRFWLVVTRPPKLKDVHTPTLDQRNANALAHMGDEEPPAEETEAPADLLAAVPEEEAGKIPAPSDEPKEEPKA